MRAFAPSPTQPPQPLRRRTFTRLLIAFSSILATGCFTLKELNDRALSLKLIGTQGQQQLAEANSALAAKEYSRAARIYRRVLGSDGMRLVDGHEEVVAAHEGLCIASANCEDCPASAAACSAFQKLAGSGHPSLVNAWPLVADRCTTTIERAIAERNLDAAASMLAAIDHVPPTYCPRAQRLRWQNGIAKARQAERTATRKRHEQELGVPIQDHTESKVTIPYELYQNPFASMGRIIALSPRVMPQMYQGSFVQLVHCDGSFGSTCGLKFDRMLSADRALYDIVIHTAGAGGGVERVSQLLVVLAGHHSAERGNMMGPLSYRYLWLVEVLGTTEGQNALGGSISVPTVRFTGYSE